MTAVITVIVVLTLALIGGLVYAGTSGALDCPKGQQYTVAYYAPIMVGKVMTVTPIYECE